MDRSLLIIVEMISCIYRLKSSFRASFLSNRNLLEKISAALISLIYICVLSLVNHTFVLYAWQKMTNKRYSVKSKNQNNCTLCMAECPGRWTQSGLRTVQFLLSQTDRNARRCCISLPFISYQPETCFFTMLTQRKGERELERERMSYQTFCLCLITQSFPIF